MFIATSKVKDLSDKTKKKNGIFAHIYSYLTHSRQTGLY